MRSPRIDGNAGIAAEAADARVCRLPTGFGTATAAQTTGQLTGVIRDLKLAGTFSWLDATYDRYLARVPGGTMRDAAGNRLTNAPAWSGSGSAVYEFAAGRFGTVSVRADVAWQTRVFFTPFNDDVETQPAYTLAHLRAGFEPQRRRWEIAFHARNVGNRQYITGTANVPLPAFTARPGDPRQWWAEFTIRH